MISTPPRAAGPLLITRPQDLASFVERVAQARRIAFDTEAASFHRYVDRVYLMQVSSDHETALIDPLALPDVAPLGSLLSSPDLEVVFHDADYDLRVLDRDFGFRARRVFDTRIAAQLLGEPAIGLAALLEKYFGVRMDKRFQRADWSSRPLSADMIAYAAADTMHLTRLRDELAHRLDAAGRLAWAQEEFLRLESIRWAAPSPEEGYWRLKGAKALPPRSQAVLRALYRWREETARALDRSMFRIMPNEALLAVARAVPTGMTALQGVRELPPSLARRHGQQLLAAVQAGMETPSDLLPKPARSPRVRPEPAQEARLERLKQMRNRRATELGLEPGVVCPNGALEAIARAAPKSREQLRQIEELQNWQVEALGATAILDAATEPVGQ